VIFLNKVTISRIRRFIHDFRIKKDNYTNTTAEIIIFTPNTLYVQRGDDDWHSQLLIRLLAHVESRNSGRIKCIALPPFFYKGKFTPVVNTINNYFLFNFALGFLRMWSFNKAIAFVFDKFLNKVNPKQIYFTNLSLPIEHLQYSGQYIEYCHGKGYVGVPFYFNNRNVNKISEIITLDKIAFDFFSNYEDFKNIKISQMQKLPPLVGDNDCNKILNLKIKYKKVILFTLTHGYGKKEMCFNNYGYYLDNGLIPDNFISWFKSREDVCVIFRKHPIHNHVEYKWVDIYMNKIERSCSNAFFADFKYTDLSDLLTTVDIHLTMCSGAVFDAAECGLNSITLCPSIKEMPYLNVLVNRGKVEKVSYLTFNYDSLCVD
jgi:hypothetical protein